MILSTNNKVLYPRSTIVIHRTQVVALLLEPHHPFVRTHPMAAPYYSEFTLYAKCNAVGGPPSLTRPTPSQLHQQPVPLEVRNPVLWLASTHQAKHIIFWSQGERQKSSAHQPVILRHVSAVHCDAGSGGCGWGCIAVKAVVHYLAPAFCRSAGFYSGSRILWLLLSDGFIEHDLE